MNQDEPSFENYKLASNTVMLRGDENPGAPVDFKKITLKFQVSAVFALK